MVPEAGIEPARLAAGDFESPASTNFTTRADCEESDYDIFIFALWVPTRRSALEFRKGASLMCAFDATVNPEVFFCC